MSTRRAPNRRTPVYSPSALETFKACQRQFEFRYLLKPDVKEAASPHLLFGNALHAALAFLYRLPLEQRSLEIAKRALRHFWARDPGRGEAFLNDEEEAAWGHKALDALCWFCANYDTGIRPLAVEDWIRATLPNDRVVCGKADRIDRARGLDRGVEVVDYKSGRCRIEDGELGQDLAARLYALAAARTYRQPVVRVRFIYLTQEVERCWYPEKEDLTAIETELCELTDRVVATKVFLPSPGPLCRWCKYKTLCPASDHASLAELDDTPELCF